MSETALALVQSITAVEFFKPGASKTVIENLKIEVRAQAAKLDISTEDGRRDIASLAFKVAKSKTGLDKAGKELVADQKAAIKRIDAERATVWDELEALQKEVRQPLTDFENAEKDRIAEHRAALAEADKREQDKAHKASVHNDAEAALIAGGMGKTAARMAVTIIAREQVPHIRISY